MSHQESTPGCPSRFHLYGSLINILQQQNRPPTGRWSDYNPDFAYQEYLNGLIEAGIFCESDMPSEPQVGDYTDLEAPRTRGNPC